MRFKFNRKLYLSLGLCLLSILSTLVLNSCSQNVVKANSTQTQVSTVAQKPQVAQVSNAYRVINEARQYTYTVQPSQILSAENLPKARVNFNQADLLTTLVNTRKYYQEHSSADPDILRPGLLGTQGITIEDTLKTLEFMIAVLQEDISNRRPTRLQNPDFINQNFRVIRWTAHNPRQPAQKQVRLTKYAVFTHPGSRTKTSTFNIPIYSLKDEFAGNKFYTQYTKQDVLAGIYEPGGKEYGKVEPLAYLTRQGLEEALMEGTILINFPDGTSGYFNVDRSNEIPFVKGVNPRQQKRYWYFRKVDAIKGYGYKIDAKISIKPGVTFAGDVLNIGLGRMVVLESGQGRNRRLRMAVIADTGGAFLPSLYQLDYLSGVFKNKQDFQNYIRTLPEFANAYILVKK
ncbi:MAG: hypothetical protein IGS39_10735 [Calothrix sp. C42_A2020_038]|nr:hypothetical protein [Calothrix sp. C42_A2020_038]